MKFFPLIDERPSCVDLHNMVEDERLNKAAAPEAADVLLIGGGDGFMLKMMRQWHHLGKPFMGMNCGTLGFLLNALEPERLFSATMESVEQIQVEKVGVKLTYVDGTEKEGFYFNDCVLGGNILDYYSFQASVGEETITIKGTGLVVSTSLGSTGYALNLGQPLMPLRSSLRGLCGIASAPFRYTFVNQQNISILFSGKTLLMVGLDGYNDQHEQVKEISIYPTHEHATLLFFCDQRFDEKRLFLAQEKLGK